MTGAEDVVESSGGSSGGVGSTPNLRIRPNARLQPPTPPTQNTDSPQFEVTEKEGGAWRKLRTSCGGIVMAVVIASVIIYIASPAPMKPRLWTKEDLARYNGSDGKLPILLSILGSVFDVSKGRTYYGPGGGYSHFAGRDASRAFVSGNFTGDGLTDSLKGLSASQVKSIDDWRIFYVKNYLYVGKLIGTFYDEEGKPRKELQGVEKKRVQAAEFVKQQKADEERFPNCNSRWSEDKGGEVWCDSGYPRLVERVAEVPRKGPSGTRCACFEVGELGRPSLREYEGCQSDASLCKTS